METCDLVLTSFPLDYRMFPTGRSGVMLAEFFWISSPRLSALSTGSHEEASFLCLGSGSWNAVKKHRWGLTCLEIRHFLEQRVWLRLLCSGFGCCLCKLGSVILCVCLCVCICQTTHQPVCWFRLLLRDSHFLSVYLVKLTHLWV